MYHMIAISLKNLHYQMKRELMASIEVRVCADCLTNKKVINSQMLILRLWIFASRHATTMKFAQLLVMMLKTNNVRCLLRLNQCKEIIVLQALNVISR